MDGLKEQFDGYGILDGFVKSWMDGWMEGIRKGRRREIDFFMFDDLTPPTLTASKGFFSM
jgi:hypothetical protein